MVVATAHYEVCTEKQPLWPLLVCQCPIISPAPGSLLHRWCVCPSHPKPIDWFCPQCFLKSPVFCCPSCLVNSQKTPGVGCLLVIHPKGSCVHRPTALVIKRKGSFSSLASSLWRCLTNACGHSCNHSCTWCRMGSQSVPGGRETSAKLIERNACALPK